MTTGETLHLNDDEMLMCGEPHGDGDGSAPAVKCMVVLVGGDCDDAAAPVAGISEGVGM